MNEQKMYCMKCESLDDQLLMSLNDQYNIFKDLVRQDLYCRYDFVGTATKSNMKCNIELKCRTTMDYEDLFIEKTKFEYLMEQYNLNKNIPVYINFTTKGEAVIYNLLAWAKETPKLIEVTIWDHMNSRYKKVLRYLLPKSKGKQLNFTTGL